VHSNGVKVPGRGVNISQVIQSRLFQKPEIRREFKMFQRKANEHKLEEVKLHITVEKNRFILQGDL